ncbi:MAG: hypothetical protein RRY39_06745 [Odoribacter sp.]
MVVVYAILWGIGWTIGIIIIIGAALTAIAWTVITIQCLWTSLLCSVGFFIPKKYKQNQTINEDQPCNCDLPFEHNTRITITIKKGN